MANNISNSNAFNAFNAFEKTQNVNKKTDGIDQSKIPSTKPNETSFIDNSTTKSDTFTPTKPDERGFITGRPMNPFSEIYNNPKITLSPIESPIEGPIPAPIITLSPIERPIPDPKITLSPIKTGLLSPEINS